MNLLSIDMKEESAQTESIKESKIMETITVKTNINQPVHKIWGIMEQHQNIS